jgi:N-acyl homoserine lactone hydrolase
MAVLKLLGLAGIVVGIAACHAEAPPAQREQANQTADAHPAAAALSLSRLDCGSLTIKNFDEFFSDRPGLYPPGPRKITDSCYVIHHGDQIMLWDTGLSADLKGKSMDMGDLVASLDKTIPEQLAAAKLTPADVDVLGISHEHSDHTGQAALFTNARLLIGKADFADTSGKDDPFGPWRAAGKPVTLVTQDTDVFGDGSVIALHTPGHTPDHLALLVKLASGPVLLTGDIYHSTMAREKRGVPPFNTSREQTLASMDKFEALAKKLGAKVIIQHEPADITKLPAFPAEAR